ncbi:MAG: hypothetical protein AB1540_06745 [Bdellovibrionota bacterium]
MSFLKPLDIVAFILTWVLPVAVHADPSDLIPGSIGDEKQLGELYEVVRKELRSGRPDAESIQILNQALKERGLPQIETGSKDFSLSPALMVGFASSDIVGVEIRDGRHLFCLPCRVGHNEFRRGLLPWAKSERDPKGPYFALINKVAAMERYGRNGTTNSKVWPDPRRVFFVVNEKADQGVMVFTDSGIEFFEVALSIKSYFEFHVLQPTQGKAFGVVIRRDINDETVFSVEQDWPDRFSADDATKAVKPKKTEGSLVTKAIKALLQ